MRMLLRIKERIEHQHRPIQHPSIKKMFCCSGAKSSIASVEAPSTLSQPDEVSSVSPLSAALSSSTDPALSSEENEALSSKGEEVAIKVRELCA